MSCNSRSALLARQEPPVAPDIPRTELSRLVGRYSVSSPDFIIAYAVWQRSRNWPVRARKQAVRYALHLHGLNRNLTIIWRL
jgi:hypothetical protein